MGDFIPQEELEKFLATCNDASVRKFSREAADKAKIQADNVGHRLLSKMGWKEGPLSLSLSPPSNPSFLLTHQRTHCTYPQGTTIGLNNASL